LRNPWDVANRDGAIPIETRREVERGRLGAPFPASLG
jgi:hypothetical protein